MQLRLIVYGLAIALSSAGMVAFAAGPSDVNGRLDQAPPWVHKVPAFVCDRVELVSGLAVSQPPGNVGLNGSKRFARDQVHVPGRLDSTCASAAQMPNQPVVQLQHPSRSWE